MENELSPGQTPRSALRNVLRFVGKLLRKKEAGIFLALVGMTILISIFQPKFATTSNLYLVCRQVSYTAIMALGVFFVILTGGIDLSIGSMVTLSGVVAGWALSYELNPCLAVLAGLLTGALVGSFNGVVVSEIGVTPFIVTLGSMGMAGSLAMATTGGNPIQGIPQGFLDLAIGDFMGIPAPVIALVSIAVFSHILLTYSAFGRRIYAIGGNEEATRLSGINVREIKFFVYIISGVLCAITGILYIGRLGSASATSGQDQELDAIAAAVIGGTSLMGGEGSVPGVLIGALIMGVIRAALPMIGISAFWQRCIIGAIIVLAAILDVWRSKRR